MQTLQLVGQHMTDATSISLTQYSLYEHEHALEMCYTLQYKIYCWWFVCNVYAHNRNIQLRGNHIFTTLLVKLSKVQA